MFTGLIEEVGTVLAVDAGAEGSRISVAASVVLEGVKPGDSIAVDGACMTVVAFDAKSFTFEASPESLSKTNFKTFKPGVRVNLERPLTPQSRIGGHYVTGHVDGQAEIVSIRPEGNSIIYTFDAKTQALAELLVEKGSVALLGISLTVNAVEGSRFSVAIIPHTLAHTNLGDYLPGDPVNIETDLLGKYVRRLMFARENAQAGSAMTGTLENGAIIDDAALVPALNAVTRPESNIRTGGWFNFQ